MVLRQHVPAPCTEAVARPSVPSLGWPGYQPGTPKMSHFPGVGQKHSFSPERPERRTFPVLCGATATGFSLLRSFSQRPSRTSRHQQTPKVIEGLSEAQKMLEKNWESAGAGEVKQSSGHNGLKLFAPSKLQAEQPLAAEKLLEQLRRDKDGRSVALLHGRTGTGKTRVTAEVISKLGLPTLFFCHTRELAHQHFETLRRFFGDDRVFLYIAADSFGPCKKKKQRKGRSVKEELQARQQQEQRNQKVLEVVASNRRDYIIVTTVKAIFPSLMSPDGSSLPIIVPEDKRAEVEQSVRKELTDAQPEGLRRRKCAKRANPTQKDKKEARQRLDKKVEKELQSFMKTGDPDRKPSLLKSLVDLGWVTFQSLVEMMKEKRNGEYFQVHDESHRLHMWLKGPHQQQRSTWLKNAAAGECLPSRAKLLPLPFSELLKQPRKLLMMSATPGSGEVKLVEEVVTMTVRPNGVLDPEIEIRVGEGDQMPEVLQEIREAKEREEKSLIFVSTKAQADEVCAYLARQTIPKLRVDVVHSSVQEKQGVQELRRRIDQFQMSKATTRRKPSDVLVSVGMLQEGFDLPSLSRVIILDADRRCLLRWKQDLIQMAGRAARHEKGKVLLIGKEETEVMREVKEDADDARKRQQEWYDKNGQLFPGPRTEETFDSDPEDHKAQHGKGSPRNPAKKQERQSLTAEQQAFRLILMGSGCYGGAPLIGPKRSWGLLEEFDSIVELLGAISNKKPIKICGTCLPKLSWKWLKQHARWLPGAVTRWTALLEDKSLDPRKKAASQRQLEKVLAAESRAASCSQGEGQLQVEEKETEEDNAPGGEACRSSPLSVGEVLAKQRRAALASACCRWGVGRLLPY